MFQRNMKCSRKTQVVCFTLLTLFLIFYLYYNPIHRIHTDLQQKNITETIEDVGWNRSEKLVIVVQVHNREMYLKHLIDSLRGAAGIEKAFLIFSHDYYDDHLNKLIATVDFCKYKQIYYPYSIQKFPNKFPGSEIDADGKNNSNRNPDMSQMKHHWWWKANTVFNWVSFQNYSGLVLLLEEDFYVVEDFIHVLQLMKLDAIESCKSCEIFSLASNSEAVHIESGKASDIDIIQKSNRFSNMGIAFNLVTWNKILNCKDSFCKYNDNNWDFSLQYLIKTCLENTETVILLFPRIFHIGSCGMHVTSNDCDPSQTLLKIKEKIESVKKMLFPKKLTHVKPLYFKTTLSVNGGWNDVRDYELCENITTLKNTQL